MKETYRPVLKSHVLTDDADRVRAIRHTGEYWESPTGGGLVTAVTYLRSFASVYEVPDARFDRLETKVSFLNPREQGEEYRLGEERRQFDSETFGFYQTYPNVTVWRPRVLHTLSADHPCAWFSARAGNPSLRPARPPEKISAGGPQFTGS